MIDQAMFEELCKAKCQFLICDFAFELKHVFRKRWYESISYSSEQVGLRIDYAPREGGCGVFIWLVRLINGEFPPYPSSYSPQMPIGYADLLDIVALSDPVEYDKMSRLSSFKSSEECCATLDLFALCLKRFAADVLVGQFEVFTEVEKRIKERAIVHGQRPELNGKMVLEAD